MKTCHTPANPVKDLPRVIAVDFDGTIVEHKFPDVGDPVPMAIDTLLDLQDLGVQIILWTMRSGEGLSAAINYLEFSGVKLWGINENPEQKSWSRSPKAYAPLYIDDAAFGCPVIVPGEGRPYVNWAVIRHRLGLKP